MQILWLIALSSLAGALLVAIGNILGYLLATRTMRWMLREQIITTEQKPKAEPVGSTHSNTTAGPYPGHPPTVPQPPADSGPVKLMQPEDYAAERMEPMKRKIAAVIGIKEDPEKP